MSRIKYFLFPLLIFSSVAYADCRDIEDWDKRQYCNGECGAIENSDLRELCKTEKENKEKPEKS